MNWLHFSNACLFLTPARFLKGVIAGRWLQLDRSCKLDYTTMTFLFIKARETLQWRLLARRDMLVANCQHCLVIDQNWQSSTVFNTSLWPIPFIRNRDARHTGTSVSWYQNKKVTIPVLLYWILTPFSIWLIFGCFWTLSSVCCSKNGRWVVRGVYSPAQPIQCAEIVF